jgi:DNA topoisomerase III
VIRRGASGTFYDRGLEGASHHAVIPNINTIDKLPDIWPRLSSDEKKRRPPSIRRNRLTHNRRR